jgi:hypothetical protein
VCCVFVGISGCPVAVFCVPSLCLLLICTVCDLITLHAEDTGVAHTFQPNHIHLRSLLQAIWLTATKRTAC